MLTLHALLTVCSLGIALGSAQTTTIPTSTPLEAATQITGSSSSSTSTSTSPSASATAPSLREVQRTLITGNHILDQNRVVDAYGHLSARHPTNASLFLLSRQVAPGLVASPADLVVYRVADGEAVDPDAPRGFIERYLHSEIYKAWPNVTSVLHSVRNGPGWGFRSQHPFPHHESLSPFVPCHAFCFPASSDPCSLDPR